MEKAYQIELRLSTVPSLAPLFAVVQGDTGTRIIEASLLDDDGTAFEPDEGVTAAYWSRKPDGTGTQHSSGVSISGNVVTVELAEQDTAAAGKVYAAIELSKDGGVLCAMPFWFKVAPKPTGTGTASSNDYQLIEEAAEAANEAADNANEAAGKAPYIDSTTYHWMAWDNDAKEYADTGVPANGVQGSVFYNVAQSLTAAQKLQARENIDAQETLSFDTVPTESSANPVISGGVYAAVSAEALARQEADGELSDTIDELEADIKAGTQETADYHLGFYLDEEGYVCQTAQ